MEKGTRVGAVLSADDDTVKLIGYGTYEGEEIPPEDSGGMGKILHEIGQKNPKIKLDNGGVTWGCECWWGPEKKVKEMIGNCKSTSNGLLYYRSIAQ